MVSVNFLGLLLSSALHVSTGWVDQDWHNNRSEVHDQAVLEV
jgi:hypothetical protein